MFSNSAAYSLESVYFFVKIYVIIYNSRSVRFTMAPQPLYQLDMSLGGYQSRSGYDGKDKSILAMSEIQPQSPRLVTVLTELSQLSLLQVVLSRKFIVQPAMVPL